MSETPRDPENSPSRFPENLTPEQADQIVHDLLTYPAYWYKLAQNPYPQYVLVCIVGKAKMSFEKEPEKYTEAEYQDYIFGALAPGNRCLEIAYLLSKDQKTVEALKGEYDVKVAQLEANIVAMNVATHNPRPALNFSAKVGRIETEVPSIDMDIDAILNSPTLGATKSPKKNSSN